MFQRSMLMRLEEQWVKSYSIVVSLVKSCPSLDLPHLCCETWWGPQLCLSRFRRPHESSARAAVGTEAASCQESSVFRPAFNAGCPAWPAKIKQGMRMLHTKITCFSVQCSVTHCFVESTVVITIRKWSEGRIFSQKWQSQGWVVTINVSETGNMIPNNQFIFWLACIHPSKPRKMVLSDAEKMHQEKLKRNRAIFVQDLLVSSLLGNPDPDQ